MSKFLHHAPCPECGSKDNLGVWDDNHEFCFGCGYYKASNSVGLSDIQSRLQQQEEKETTSYDSINLPFDCTRTLPKIALEWLHKYGLTHDEIHTKNTFLWSPAYEALVYGVFDPFGNLLMWQSRYFGHNLAVPRYHTEGKPESVYHIFNHSGISSTITVVEDVISAIKVGRVAHTMPLWGSTISPKRAFNLAKLYSNLNIWLDNDKKRYAVQTRYWVASYFDHVGCIITQNDPKEYSDGDIREYLS